MSVPKKFSVVFTLIMLLCAFSAWPAMAEEAVPTEAPLSPEFINWRPNTDTRQNTEGVRLLGASSQEDSFGLIPSPIDRSHLENNPPRIYSNAGSGKQRVGESIPSTYDLRNVNGTNYLTAIKNQGSYGTCWAHAAIGALESNYRMKVLSSIEGTPNLSELHMAWFVYKDPQEGRAFTVNSGSFTGGPVLGLGGNADQSTAFLSRLAGATLETNMPYTSASSSLENMQNLVGNKNPEDYERVIRLKDTYELGKITENNRDIVKKIIMSNGAVYISYKSDQTVSNTSSSTGDGAYSTINGYATYYNPETGTSTNHAVLIVGWDDNFSRENFSHGSAKPSSNGAWLIRNSWGGPDDTWSKNGYFWMSYEQYITNATAFIIDDNARSELNCYSYDPLGYCSSLGYTFNDGSVAPGWAANVFQSVRDDEALSEISFFTTDNNASYDIYVYKLGQTKPVNAPYTNSTAYEVNVSGDMPYAGYHTIKLPKLVELTKGEYFSVVVKCTTINGYNIAIENKINYSDGGIYSDPIVNEGESYFAGETSFPSSWTDGSKRTNPSNACIKAFTVPAGVAVSEANFPDEKFREFVNTKDTDKDGFLSSEEIAVVKYITLSDKNLVSLNGIEFFTALETLNCGRNKLSELDLGNNTKLTELNCTDNKLTYLDLSNNTALSILECRDNYLVSLDLSGKRIQRYSSNNEYLSRLSSRVSGDKHVTYSLTTGEYKYLFDIKEILPDNHVNISSINSTSSFDKAAGVVYFTEKPASIVYNYDTGATYEDNSKVLLPVTITVADEVIPATPIFKTEGLPDGYLTQEYNAELSADVTPDTIITWSITGELPNGLTLESSTGKISGTPETRGNFDFTVSVDNGGVSATKEFSITIHDIAPAITDNTTKNVTVTAGQAIDTITITAEGTNITWETSGDLPSGLTGTSDGNTYTISGTTNLSDAGKTINYTLAAVNTEDRASQDIVFNIENVAPELTINDNKDTWEVDPNTPISTVTITATNGTNIKWETSGTLPSGLTGASNGNTYTITGTPNESAAGQSFDYTITAANDKGNDSKKVTFKVYDIAPVFSELATSYEFEPGENQSITLTATAGTRITWTHNGTLPAGMNATNDTSSYTISGTPTTVDSGKSFTYTVTATNNKASISKAFTFNVLEQTPVLQDLAVNSYSFDTGQSITPITITATAGTNLTWTIDKTLPSGLSAQADGMNYPISGTPDTSTAGTSDTYTVTASNNRAKASKTFTINVYDIAPVFSELATSYEFEPGENQSITLTATAGTRITWTHNGTLPAGMNATNDTSSYTISGTPTTADSGKSFTYTVTAANNKASVSKTFTFNVLNEKPELESLGQTDYSFDVEQAITPVTITAAKGTNINWTIDKTLPSGLNAVSDDTTCTISGTPDISTAGQSDSYTVTAKNDRDSAAVTLTITIYDAAIELGEVQTNHRLTPNKEITPIIIAPTSGTNITWNSTGSLPEGLTGAESGDSFAISGTPTTPGSSSEYTVTASNNKSSVEKKFTFTIADSISASEPVSETATTERGTSLTTVSTDLVKQGGDKIGSVIIKIELDSTDITEEQDREFVMTGSLDVEINFNTPEYDSYSISMDVKDIAWLAVECGSADVSLDIENNSAASHHSFTLKGTPNATGSVTGKITASVTLTEKADVLTPLTISAEKEIKFTIITNPSNISIDDANLTAGYYGQAYSHDFTCQGQAENSTVTWSLAEGSQLPAGLTLDNTGKLSGTPSEVGTFTFTLKATDTHKTASKDFTLTINDIAVTIASDKTTLTGTAGKDALTATITASQGTNITWSYSGTLPAGLSITSSDKTFTISGTPDISAAGTKSTITVTAANANNSQSVTIDITVLNVKPELDEVQNHTIEPLKSITAVKINALSGTNITWLTSGTLPSGLTGRAADDNKSFTISGTPNLSAAGQVFDYTVTASNNAGNASRKITFTVTNIAPVLDDIATAYTLESKISRTITLNASSGTNITWTTSGSLPSGMTGTSDGMTFTITGAPDISTEGNKFTYTVTASNSAGTSSKEFTFNVANRVAIVKNDPVITLTDNGDSITQITSNLTNSNGVSLGNITMTMIIESLSMQAESGGEFSQTGSIELDVDFNNSEYSTYILSFDVQGMPSWMSFECESVDTSIDITDSHTSYYHVFTLKGTPNQSAVSSLKFLAEILFTGNAPDLTLNCTDYAEISVTEPPAASLVSLDVAITGNTSLTLEAGTSGTLSLTASVNEIYDDGTIIPGDYALTWTTPGYDPESYDMAFSNGVLTVNDSAKADSYNIPVRVTVTSGDVTGQADTVLYVTLTNSQHQGQSIVTAPETISIVEFISNMTDEAKQQVTTIKITANITSLSGIEELANLQSIDLSENTVIEEVDLSGNTSVKTVTLTGNVTVKIINLTNSNVETVDANGCKSVIEVNIAGSSVKNLDLSNTSITQLNAKDCAKLEVLKFSACNVVVINLDGCVSLRELICEANSLIRLDLYKFAALVTLSCKGQKAEGWKWGRRLNFNEKFNSSIFAADDDLSTYADNVTDIEAFDADGNSIAVEYDQETGEAVFASVPASIKYNYITGFNNEKMDVTVSGSGENSDESYSEDSGGSGGGCDTGFGLVTMLGAVSLLIRRKFR